MNIPEITAFAARDLQKWLQKHHKSASRVRVIIYKKHTGKGSPSHRELIEAALCWGWIDTTIKRIDEDTFVRNFSKRNSSSRWSDNTLKYARQLIQEGRMQPEGLARYNEGRKRPTHDHGIPRNPNMPRELKVALNKKPAARKNFEKVAPSMKRMLYRYILRGIQAATRERRVRQVVANYSQTTKSMFRTTENV